MHFTRIRVREPVRWSRTILDDAIRGYGEPEDGIIVDSSEFQADTSLNCARFRGDARSASALSKRSEVRRDSDISFSVHR
jgi:hypothetical protein